MDAISTKWSQSTLILPFSVTIDLSSEEDWSLQQKVDAQAEVLGVSLAAHPLELVVDKLSDTGAISTIDAVTSIGRRITVAGVQQASHRARTA
jgi:DNA polymerase III alpha subunit